MLTTESNLKCKYCFGEVVEDFEEDFGELDIDYLLPKNTNYEYKLLERFCPKDQDCQFIFLKYAKDSLVIMCSKPNSKS